MIDWKYIMNDQPENGRQIVQIDPPFKGHYNMGMRKYDSMISFKILVQVNEKSGWPNPDFWWVYADEFPFPRQKDD